MKKMLSLFILCVMVAALFASCTSTTPDQAEKDAMMTLDKVNWTVPVEGADAAEYTMDQAKTHDLAKIVCSMVVAQKADQNGFSAVPKSFIANGVLLGDFLADIGKSDATKLTFTGIDQEGKEMEATLTAEDIQSGKVILAWVMNKTNPMPNSQSYVGLLADSAYRADFPNCCSVSKIVIG